MECEVCGREILGKGLHVLIDGANLLVCVGCAHFSTASIKREHVISRESKVSLKKIPTTVTPKIRRQTQDAILPLKNDNLELVENYSSLVRKGREAMNLTHSELSKKAGAKVSVLQKLETGKMVPDQDLTRRLERVLKIRLLQSPSKISIEKFTRKPLELTLGDVISTKNKNGALGE